MRKTRSNCTVGVSENNHGLSADTILSKVLDVLCKQLENDHLSEETRAEHNDRLQAGSKASQDFDEENKKFINETDKTSGDTIKGIVIGVGTILSALAGAKIQNAFAAKSSNEDVIDYQ